MKTFDIALKYLKDIDFSDWEMYQKNFQQEPTEKMKVILDKVKAQHEKYIRDPELKVPTDVYRDSAFEACIWHLAHLAHKQASCWDVAMEIMEANKSLIGEKFKPYMNSVYPEFIVQKWDDYCLSLDPAPTHLAATSEVRLDIFFCAYHNVMDEK